MFSVAESPLHLRFRCRKKQFAAQIPPSAAIVDRPRVAGARNTEILPPPKRGGYNTIESFNMCTVPISVGEAA